MKTTNLEQKKYLEANRLIDSTTGLPVTGASVYGDKPIPPGSIDVYGNRGVATLSDEERQIQWMIEQANAMEKFPPKQSELSTWEILSGATTNYESFPQEEPPIPPAPEEPGLWDKIKNTASKVYEYGVDALTPDAKRAVQGEIEYAQTVEPGTSQEAQDILRRELGMEPSQYMTVDRKDPFPLIQIKGLVANGNASINSNGEIIAAGKTTPFAYVGTDGIIRPMSYNTTSKMAPYAPLAAIFPLAGAAIAPISTMLFPNTTRYSQKELDNYKPTELQSAVQGFTNPMGVQPDLYHNVLSTTAGKVLGGVATMAGGGVGLGALGVGKGVTAAVSAAYPALQNISDLSQKRTTALGAATSTLADVAGNRIAMGATKIPNSVKIAEILKSGVYTPAIGTVLSGSNVAKIAGGGLLSGLGEVPNIVIQTGAGSESDVSTSIGVAIGMSSILPFAFEFGNMNQFIKANKKLAESFVNDLNLFNGKYVKNIKNGLSEDASFAQAIQEASIISPTFGKYEGVSPEIYKSALQDYIAKVKLYGSKNPTLDNITIKQDGTIHIQQPRAARNPSQSSFDVNKKPKDLEVQVQPAVTPITEEEKAAFFVRLKDAKSTNAKAINKAKTDSGLDQNGIDDFVAGYVGKGIDEITTKEYTNAIIQGFDLQTSSNSTPYYMPWENRFNPDFFDMAAAKKTKEGIVNEFDMADNTKYRVTEQMAKVETGTIYDSMIDALATVMPDPKSRVAYLKVLGKREAFIKKYKDVSSAEIKSDINDAFEAIVLKTGNKETSLTLDKILEIAEENRKSEASKIALFEQSVEEAKAETGKATNGVNQVVDKKVQLQKELKASVQARNEQSISSGSNTGAIEDAQLIHQTQQAYDGVTTSNATEVKATMQNAANKLTEKVKVLPQDEAVLLKHQVDILNEQIKELDNIGVTVTASEAKARVAANNEALNRQIVNEETQQILSQITPLYDYMKSILKSGIVSDEDQPLLVSYMRRAVELAKESYGNTSLDNIDDIKVRLSQLSDDYFNLENKAQAAMIDKIRNKEAVGYVEITKNTDPIAEQTGRLANILNEAQQYYNDQVSKGNKNITYEKAIRLAQKSRYDQDVNNTYAKIGKSSFINNLSLESKQKIAGLIGLGLAGLIDERDSLDKNEFGEAGLSAGAVLLMLGVLGGSTITGARLISKYKSPLKIKMGEQRYRSYIDEVMQEIFYDPTAGTIPKALTRNQIATSAAGVDPQSELVQAIRASSLPPDIKQKVESAVVVRAVKVAAVSDNLAESIIGKSNIHLATRELATKTEGDMKLLVPAYRDGTIEMQEFDISPKALEDAKTAARERSNEVSNEVRSAQNDVYAVAGKDGYAILYDTNLTLYKDAKEIQLALQEGAITKEEYTAIIESIFSRASIGEALAESANKLFGNKYVQGSSAYNNLIANTYNGWDTFRKLQANLTEYQADADVFKKTGQTLQSLLKEESALLRRQDEIMNELQDLKDINLIKPSSIQTNIEFEVVNNKLKTIEEARTFMQESEEVGYINGHKFDSQGTSMMTRIHEVELDKESGLYIRTPGEYNKTKIVYYNSNDDAANRATDEMLTKLNAEPIPGTRSYLIDAIDPNGKIKYNEDGSVKRVAVSIVKNDMSALRAQSRNKLQAIESFLSDLSGNNVFKTGKNKQIVKQIEGIIADMPLEAGGEDVVTLRTIKEAISKATTPDGYSDIAGLLSNIRQIIKLKSSSSQSHNYYGGLSAEQNPSRFIEIATKTPGAIAESYGSSLYHNTQTNFLSSAIGVATATGISSDNNLIKHYQKISNVLATESMNTAIETNLGRIDPSKLARSVGQFFSLKALAFNFPSAIRNVLDATIQYTVIGAYTDGTLPTNSIARLGKELAGIVPTAIINRFKKSKSALIKDYATLSDTYKKIGIREEDIDMRNTMSYIRNRVRNVSREGVSEYLDDSLIPEKFKSIGYVLLRDADSMTREAATMGEVLKYIAKNPIEDDVEFEDYITEAINRASIKSNAVHGRYSVGDLNPNLAFLKTSPTWSILEPMMAPWKNNMGMFNTMLGDAVLYNHGNKFRSLQALGSVLFAGTLLGGITRVPYISDAYSGLKTFEVFSANDESTLDTTPYEDLWLKTMSHLVDTYKLTQDEALAFKSVVEYGAISNIFNGNLSMDEAFSMPFVANTAMQVSEVTKATGEKALFSAIEKILMPTFVKNLITSYQMVVNGIDKEFKGTEVLNKEVGYEDVIMQMLRGNELDKAKFSSNQFMANNPLDLGQEREKFLTKVIGRSGITLSGRNISKKKTELAQSSYLNNNALNIYKDIAKEYRSKEILSPLTYSLDKLELWFSEPDNIAMLKANALKDSEQTTYGFKLEDVKNRMRKEIYEYYMNEVVISVMNKHIEEGKRQGKLVPSKLKKSKNVRGNILEQGFNKVMEGIK
jgi:hypothetical protein